MELLKNRNNNISKKKANLVNNSEADDVEELLADQE